LLVAIFNIADRLHSMWRRAFILAVAAIAPSSFAMYGVGSLDATGFDWVGMISGASGEVISPHWVMTAKHVGGTSFTLNGATYTATQRFDHPTSDISLLYFSDVTFGGWYSPYYADPTGETLTYVGYGLTATARVESSTELYPYTGYHMVSGSGGVKRLMTNTAGGLETVDYGWGSAWITTCIAADLDYTSELSPETSRVDTLGDGGATSEEGGLLYGDSGSPALLKVDGIWRVVGINVDIEDANGPNPGGDDNYLDFGDTMYSTWVGAYQGWMETTMSSVPEPASLSVLAFGGVFLLLKRKKK
jgi:hypothetical protein